MTVQRKTFYWLATTSSVLLHSIFAVLFISEWWIVGMEKNFRGYPFGPVNDSPWYYATPTLYSTVNFVQGITLGTILLLLIWQMVRGKKNRVMILNLVGLTFLALALINSFLH